MALIFFGSMTLTPDTGGVGTTVQIDNTGAGFIGTMVVTFDGVAADNIAVDTGHGNGQQRLTCDVPAGVSIGAVDVYIENPDGENVTLSGAFTTIAGVSVGRVQMAVGVYVGM